MLEACGLVVRIPDWWKAGRAPRPQVRVQVGERPAAVLGAEAVLDFSVGMTLDGEALTDAEKQQLLSAGGLIRLRGRGVEADGEVLGTTPARFSLLKRVLQLKI